MGKGKLTKVFSVSVATLLSESLNTVWKLSKTPRTSPKSAAAPMPSFWRHSFATCSCQKKILAARVYSSVSETLLKASLLVLFVAGGGVWWSDRGSC